MSLRNVASSLDFCCARAPTNDSLAPANATATYSSHRQCSLRLWTALLIDAVILDLLATRDKSLQGGCPNMCRLPYSYRRHIASDSACISMAGSPPRRSPP